MSVYPENLVELMDMFPNEESCLEYLSIIRWPNGYQCSRCHAKNTLKIGRGLYRCKACKYENSVISGTLFQDSHKPLRLWFQAVWYIINQKNGVSALGLQKALGLGSYHTAWEWLHKLRRAMVRPGRDKLSGVVEVNETLIGGEKSGKRGRGAAGKTLVLIAAEENQGGGVGRIRLSPIRSASSEVLSPTITQIIEQGSTIRTDGWNGYNDVDAYGYKHLPSNNDNIRDSDAIPLAHLIASLLKRWLLGTHQGAVNPKKFTLLFR